jgi:uncharacterized protein
MPIHAAKLPGVAPYYAHGYTGYEGDLVDRFIGRDMSSQDWDELERLLAEDQAALTTNPSSGIPATLTTSIDNDDDDEPGAQDEVKAAGIALLTPSGEALFLKRHDRSDEPGTWSFPGGRMDGEETPEEAAMRETREETGWIPEEELDLEEAARRDGYITYRKKVGNQFIPTLDDENVAWAWAPLDAAPEPLHPGVKKTLDKIAKDAKVSQETAQYQFEMHGRDHCAICTMFREPDSCTTVAGTISPNGWCKYFELRKKPKDEADGEMWVKRIDRRHDVRWLSVLSSDGRTMYVHRGLPRTIENNGKILDVAQPLLRHENAEFKDMKRRLAAFIERHGCEPNDEERKDIYLVSHRTKGNPAEKTWIKDNGYDWDDWEAWCNKQIRQLENAELTNTPPDPDVRPIPHGRGELEFASDKRILAFDRSLDLQKLDRRGIAFDYESVRHYSKDGHLHIARAPISKANVCPYIGYEIPNYEKLGLDPNKIYKLLRDPEELKKAASTFNGKPLLGEHIPVDAGNHPKKDTLGATGTDAEFEDPYLYNSLVVWSDDGIKPIEANKKKELSSAYHYDADMHPGVYKGEKYDGVMRNIVGNHVALVREGRAGADVVIGDSAITDVEQIMSAKPITLTRKGAMTMGALVAFLKPKLAKDAKLDWAPLVGSITHKNFKEKKAELIKGVTEQTKGKLAQDANIEGLVELIDALEGSPPAGGEMEPVGGGAPVPEGGAPAPSGAEPGSEEQPDEGDEENEQLKSFLASKGMSEDDIAQACKLAGGGGDQEPDEHGNIRAAHEEEATDEHGNEPRHEGEPEAMDDPIPFKGMPKPGGTMAGDKATTVDPKANKKVTRRQLQATLAAMDESITAAVEKAKQDAKKEAREQYEKDIKLATDAANENARKIREAENEVRPWVGTIPTACDSAEMVYQTALAALDVPEAKDVKDLTALKAILKHIPQPGAKRTPTETSVAMDSAAINDFAKRNPHAARIDIVI